MSTIKTKNIQQTVISGTTQPLKIGGIAADNTDAKITIGTDGTTTIRKTRITDNAIEINKYNTGNRSAAIKLIGDDTYTDYGAQLLRYSTGHTELMHRGSQTLNITAVDAASLMLSTNASGRLIIDSVGRVTMPYQPAFTMGSNFGWFTTTGIMPFNVANLNRGNYYNTSTSQFTAPVAGVYAFSVQLLTTWSSAGQYHLRKNNATLLNRISHMTGSTSGEYNYSGGTFLIQLDANDIIDCYCASIGSGGNGIYLGEGTIPYSWFSGWLIG